MEYRVAEVRQRLEKVGREASMLHVDVLLLIYHCAHFGLGNVLEIAPSCRRIHDCRGLWCASLCTRKEIVTIEAGWSVKHVRLSSRDIIKD
jgi:hypothetical protein